MLHLMILILACGGSSEKPPPTNETETTSPGAGVAAEAGVDREGTHCAEGERVVLSCALPERVPEVLSVCSKTDTLHVRFGELGKPEVSSATPVKHTRQSAGDAMSSESWSFTHNIEETWVVSDQRVGDERRIELTRAAQDGSSVSWLCGDPPAAATSSPPTSEPDPSGPAAR